MTDIGEIQPPLRERIARALWEFAYADDFPEPWPTDGEDREIAMLSGDAVLADLGRWVQEQANIAHSSRYGEGQEHGDYHSCPCLHEAASNLAQAAEEAAESGRSTSQKLHGL